MLSSTSSIAGIIFYGVLASLIATLIIFFVKRFFCSPSTTQVNKQKINGKGILNITQPQNVRVISPHTSLHEIFGVRKRPLQERSFSSLCFYT